MSIKTVLYLLFFPLVLFSLDSIQINKIFKKGKEFQAKLFYFFLTIVFSYFVVNFFYDFFMYSKFI